MTLGPGSASVTPSVALPVRLPISLHVVQRQFERRSELLATRDVLLREISARMIDRLGYIRLDPQTILDVGCGLGRSRDPLLERYPEARWIGIDVAASMLRAGRIEERNRRGLFARWSSNKPAWVLADGGVLPIASDSIDLVFSNGMLHWQAEPHTVFPEWKRVLRTDGLLMFSTFGPDTLKELRACATRTLPHVRPMPYVDMHDFGDMMVANGFATPVMDVETLVLSYASARDLIADVRALGGNPRIDRWPALASGPQARRLLAALEGQRGPDGRIALTFEVAFGHAWKPAGQASTKNKISLESLREQLSQRRR